MMRLVCVFLLMLATPLSAQVVTVDPAAMSETMRGWEVQNEANKERADYQAFRQTAVDKVAEAGINRIRFEVRAGSEHTVDNYAAFSAAGFPTSGTANTTWRAKRYETVNDNSDPNVINPAGFKWTEIDAVAVNLVNPLRAKLAAQGESLYVNLTYVAFLAQVTSGAPYVHQSPAEYAEFLLATFQHLQSTYGWVPNAVEVILEPDNVQPTWTGTQIGLVIAAAGPRLAAAGFTPDFIAPSTTALDRAVPYLNAALAVPGAAAYIKELSYHRYAGVSTANLQAIAAKGVSAGVATAMLEMWDPGGLSVHTLHEDLKVGRNSAWQQAAFVSLNDVNGIGVAHINTASPTVGAFTNLTKFTSLYYKWVRMGARRIAASSTRTSLDPLAWKNVNGTVTVVAKTTQGETFTIGGLPAGTYGIAYTQFFSNNQGTMPDVTITAGQQLTAAIPSTGVIAVYGKTGGVPPPVCEFSPWVLTAFEAWGACVNNTQSRGETWTRTVTVQPPSVSCLPIEEARTGTQACTPPPVGPTTSITSELTPCTLTVGSSGAPDTQSGWGVDFFRQAAGSSTWVAHGARVTSAPFLVAQPVAAGAWTGKAVWTRAGSTPYEAIASATAVCQP